MTDQDYLTILEAAEYVSTSDRTVRRRITDIVNGKIDNAGEYRFHILPTAKEKAEGSKEPWKINKALLHILWPKSATKTTDTATDTTTESSGSLVDRLLAMNEKQTELLETAMERQDQRIESLKSELDETKEELKEANHIITELKQDQLTAGKQETDKPGEAGEPQPEQSQDMPSAEQIAEFAKEQSTRSILQRARDYFRVEDEPAATK